MGLKEIKSEEFAIRICKLHRYLNDKGCYEISKQILRSGCSIGANIAESRFSESGIDLIHKLRISLKEANETQYWLRILYKTGQIGPHLYTSLNNDCEQLIKILVTIVNKLRNSPNP